ncbi:hypothetical protein BDR26DRAFT_868930, partial [Obelidium mucronatum]
MSEPEQAAPPMPTHPVLVPSPTLPPQSVDGVPLPLPAPSASASAPPPPAEEPSGHGQQSQSQQQQTQQSQQQLPRLAPLSPQLPIPQGMAQQQQQQQFRLPQPQAQTYQQPQPQIHHQPQPPPPPQQQQQQQQQQEGSRSLNVKDALTYLDQVKAQFANQPDVYNRFLDIMKDFKSQAIDTPGVIDRVSNLFRGHPSLVTGFNTFLPPGYRIEATSNPLEPFRVINPNDGPRNFGAPVKPVALPPASSSSSTALSLAPSSSVGPGSRHASIPPAPAHTLSPNVPHYSVGPPIPPQQHQQSGPPLPQYYASHQVQPGPGFQTQRDHPQIPTHSSLPQPYPAPVAVGVAQQQPPPPPQPPVDLAGAAKKTPNRFANDPDTYKQFLEILQTYQKESKPIQDVYAQVQILFKSAPDLLDEFRHFLPEVNSVINNNNKAQAANQGPPRGPPIGNWVGPDARRVSATNIPAPPPAQPKKAAGKRPGVFSGPQPGYPQQPGGQPSGGAAAHVPMGGVNQQPAATAAAAQPPKKRKYETTRGSTNAANPAIGGYVQGGPLASGPGTSASAFPGDTGVQNNAYAASSAAATGGSAQLQLPPPGPNGNVEELEWIDRCKRSIGNKATYNEFLKVLNLFSNEIIDSKTLVERVEPFLAKSPDLFQWFKKFVKYEEEQIVYNYPAQRAEIDPRSCRKSGHSYRQLPENYPRSQCSGRDDLCREVLNDDWISQPEYVSETGFIAHKKTIYEEALHKCEEERYEFDMNIEANLHTISLLEPIYRRIQAMTPEERSRFKLPVGLGVVLKRLKQKDEEWKRCQRDWNKVWREVDSKNYHKALDHQGINFKTTDRKQLSIKSLTSEIENLYREQQDRKRNNQVTAHYGFHSTNPSCSGVLTSNAYSRHQMDFVFGESTMVFRDARKLVLMQVGVTGAISQNEEERIGEFLSNFLKRFFYLDGVSGLENGVVPDEESGGVGEEDDVVVSGKEEGNGGAAAAGGGGGKSGQTLRREVLLKQAAAAGNAGSSNGMDIDSMSDGGDSVSGKVTTNHVRPVQKREYYPILCSRLRKMKELSDQFQKDPPHHTSTLNPIAVSLGIQSPDSLETVQPKGKDRYTDFIRAVHDLFDSKIENTEFEDRLRGLFGTSAYLSYTIDKLVQLIVKQIQSIISDPVCLDLVELYIRDRNKPVSSSRQESVYRLNAERVVEDDALYRLEYHVTPRVLTFQLINKDDPVIHEGSSVEEKWSVYVDQFIQLSSSSSATGTTGGGIHLLRTEPFLRRNLPQQVPLGPLTGDIVEMRSGLELKICLNTYKMFFVEDTEDYFARRRSGGGVGGNVRGGGGAARSVATDAVTGREKGNLVRLNKFQAWMEQRMEGISKDEAEWVLVDKAIAVKGDDEVAGAQQPVDGDGDVEMK